MNSSRRRLIGALGGAAACSGMFGRGLRLAYAQQSSGDELAFLSAKQLTALLREGQISSVELTRYFIDRIERHDRAIDALVVHDFERALQAAAIERDGQVLTGIGQRWHFQAEEEDSHARKRRGRADSAPLAVSVGRHPRGFSLPEPIRR